MSKTKKRASDLPAEEVKAKTERKAAKARAKFEKREAKLKRRVLKSEVILWDAELDLLEFYAEAANEEGRAEYADEIVRLQTQLDNAHTLLKQYKKTKKKKHQTQDEAASSGQPSPDSSAPPED